MLPVSLRAGQFLGLQRVSTLLPHFSQVKTAMGCLQISLNHHLRRFLSGWGSLAILPGKAAILMNI